MDKYTVQETYEVPAEILKKFIQNLPLNNTVANIFVAKKEEPTKLSALLGNEN